ncbi:hypothetical protein BDZ94DRAFT_150999 [Collybia nuda]|uniref:Uncharacterized protein n=1 Tax=Collybia nuda TaxID=64659 RepID=A0A9P5XUQ0_9AGAR|nr:hypothetical protein BDZ94DRAFT_150999 [Collybia nuda]
MGFQITSLDVAEQYERASNRCLSRDCRVFLDPGTPEVEYTQCLIRRHKVNQGTAPLPRRIHQSTKEVKYQQECHQSYVNKASKLPTCPQYKCLSALLLDLVSRLSEFLEAQMYYFSLTAVGHRQPQPTAFFSFDGEFSVVSLDFDVMRRKEEVDQGTLKLKEEIEKLGGLCFSSTNRISVVGGAIIRKFMCVHEASVALPEKNPRQRALKVEPKSMQGELEIVVVADESHRFFPGQRTVVRFRLIG